MAVLQQAAHARASLRSTGGGQRSSDCAPTCSTSSLLLFSVFDVSLLTVRGTCRKLGALQPLASSLCPVVNTLLQLLVFATPAPYSSTYHLHLCERGTCTSSDLRDACATVPCRVHPGSRQGRRKPVHHQLGESNSSPILLLRGQNRRKPKHIPGLEEVPQFSITVVNTSAHPSGWILDSSG